MLFDRFTNKAKEAIRLAAVLAGEMGHSYVGTEHLLVGFLQEGTSVAAAVLKEHGVE